MAREDGLPPKIGKGRKGPEMMDEDPAIVSKLSQLADQGEEASGGMMMGGGGGSEEQSANLVLSGAQQLIQAAQMNPALQEVVGQVIGILQQGMQRMAGQGQGGPPGEMGGGRGGGGRRRMRPPKVEREPEGGAGEDQFAS